MTSPASASNRLSADETLEQTFFRLEAGIDLAQIALHDALEAANDEFGKAFAANQQLQGGQFGIDAAEGGFAAQD